MTNPVPNSLITAPFTQPRPFGGPYTHIHAALDLSAPGAPLIVAPVSGLLTAYQFIRPKGGTWAAHDEKPEILHSPPHNYFYDIYGGLLTIEEPQGRYHILAHFWGSALHSPYHLHYVESVYTPPKLAPSFPCIAFISDPIHVNEGEPLIRMGNAGYSSGPHVHWEIHPSRNLVPHSDRIDPTPFIKGVRP